MLKYLYKNDKKFELVKMTGIELINILIDLLSVMVFVIGYRSDMCCCNRSTSLSKP